MPRLWKIFQMKIKRSLFIFISLNRDKDSEKLYQFYRIYQIKDDIKGHEIFTGNINCIAIMVINWRSDKLSKFPSIQVKEIF